jgi:glycosyltransferase involved in cell wall biosynthesis
LNILFIHQNMPAQFKHLAPALAADPKNRVVFLTQRSDVKIPRVETVSYTVTREAKAATHQYVRLFENNVASGQEVVRALQKLRTSGFKPDVVIAHSGWGEALFVKDMYPKVPLIVFSEFYYRRNELYFDPHDKVTLDQICRLRARSANLLLSLDACDAAITPTYWQKSVQPAAFHNKISVIFDGIDTKAVSPDTTAAFTLDNGRVLNTGDEVVTYVARNLEPYRGFPSFMRALPKLLDLRPDAQVVIVGGDKVSYGSKPVDGRTWRETMLGEVSFDATRVHFIPRLSYARYLALLRISSAHVYLTYPFVLSWSFMEAMAAGCLVVGSKTEPVEEMIRNGMNGLLTDFHEPADIARTVADALAAAPELSSLRHNARQLIVDRYDVKDCLVRQKRLITSLMR